MSTKASLMALFPRLAPTAVGAKGAKGAEGVDAAGGQPPAEGTPPAGAAPATTAAAPTAGAAPTTITQEPTTSTPPPEPAPASAAPTLDKLKRRKKALDATITRLRRLKSSPDEVDFMAQAQLTPSQQELAEAEREKAVGEAGDALAEARAERIEILKDIAERSDAEAVSKATPIAEGAPTEDLSEPMFRHRGKEETQRRLREGETGQREIPKLAPTHVGRLLEKTAPGEPSYVEPYTGEKFEGKPTTATDVASTMASTMLAPLKFQTIPHRYGAGIALSGLAGLRGRMAENEMVFRDWYRGDLGTMVEMGLDPNKLDDRRQFLRHKNASNWARGHSPEGLRTTAKGELPEVRDVPEAEKRSVFHGLPLNERVDLAISQHEGAMQTLGDIDAAIQQMDKAGKTYRQARYKKLQVQRALIQERVDTLDAIKTQLRRVRIAEANKQKVPVEGESVAQL